MTRKLSVGLIAIALSAAVMPAQASVQVVTNGPAAHLTGFATQVVVVSKSAPLTYLNGDPLFQHNVEATSSFGSDSNYWCSLFTAGRCPIFWSPLIGAPQSTVVDGMSQTEVGKAYAFKCAPHPWMTGLIVVVP